MSSNGSNDNKYVKGGAEKAHLKRDLQLKALGNDPKQKKICFAKNSDNAEVNVEDGTSSTITKSDIILNDDCYVELPSQTLVQEILNFVQSHEVNADATSESVQEKLNFVQLHTRQPMDLETMYENVSWSFNKLYNRVLEGQRGKLILRKWLSIKSYRNKVEAIYCAICIAFSTSETNFSSECTNFKNIYQSVEKHEKSHVHNETIQSFIQASNHNSIEHLVNRNMMNLNRKQVNDNIHVLEQVFKIVKLLAKQNLAYRGTSNNEALYNFDDESNLYANKGNFLELVHFASEQDAVLNNHLNLAIKRSKKRKQSTSTKERGSLVTLLSKTTVNKVIIAIGQSMKNIMKKELGDQIFSTQVDSTQDIEASDQAAICIRYMCEGEIKKRLFALLRVEKSTGKALHELLKSYVLTNNIDFKNIVGESFDGAANMRGEFNGLHAYIKNQNEKSVYVWCHAHILNLCICDSCENIYLKNLFGLLNRLSTFFSESYKRMNVWIETLKKSNTNTGVKKLRKLQKIDETRWWSREKALKWVFSGDDCLFTTVLSDLDFVSNSSTFDPKTSSKAASLRDKLCDFNIILTAHLFLEIFKIVEPTSKYLQTSNLDMLSAWEMVEHSKEMIGKIKFSLVFSNAKQFSFSMNDVLSETDISETVIVQSELPQPRIRKKKKNFDENCADELIKANVVDKFRIEEHYLIPKNLKNQIYPEYCLSTLSDLVGIDRQKLISELQSFSNIYENIVGSLNKRTKTIYKRLEVCSKSDDDNIDDLESESDDFDFYTSVNYDYDMNDQTNNKQTSTISKGCNKKENDHHNEDRCLICVHKLLNSLNMHSSTFSNLYSVYEYILTLSCTQVKCERSFSKLKIIKNRLRSSLGQDHLEIFMLMSIERDILETVDFSEILEYVKGTSDLMKKMLT
ncbi:hypothetical protein AGLY_012405 [Aphis glycines]|uniref:DUF4371 domain-containing protein n=1 Tax=Aphis glycines TaxID=307491 RepID=A0A6G0T9Z5_APHGL|nr:hypothetical protein AGLY_012405 [Aphis glycines]